MQADVHSAQKRHSQQYIPFKARRNNCRNISCLYPTQPHASQAGHVSYRITVGSVCARKDQLTLVKACALLQDLDFRLVIAGDELADAEYSKLVRKQAAALGDKVTFLGHVTADELHDAYNHSHILANLSLWK